MITNLDTKSQKNIALFVNTGRESSSNTEIFDTKLQELKHNGITQIIVASI
jgi:hypothetical protein